MIDKNYWLNRWRQKRLLNLLWKIYPENDMSWNEIITYFKSNDIEKDIMNDILKIVKKEKTIERGLCDVIYDPNKFSHGKITLVNKLGGK